MNKVWLAIPLCLFLMTQLHGQSINKDELTVDQIKGILNLYISKVGDELKATGNATECFLAIIQLFEDSSKIKKIYDALAKPGSGIFEGDLYMMGNYDECVALDSSHYCILLNVKTSIFQTSGGNSIVPIGTCAPTECSAQDLSMILVVSSKMLEKFLGKEYFIVTENNGTNFKYGIPDGYCYSNQKTQTQGSIIMMAVTGFLLLLTAVGTFVHFLEYMLVDRRSDYERNQPVKFALCFSLAKNTKFIFSTDEIPEGTIESLNGIRVIAMTWIILGQMMQYSTSYLRDDVLINKWRDRFSMQIVLNASLAVDTFFIMSGLLVSYHFLRRDHRRRKDNEGELTCKNCPWFVVKHYAHRYFRLTPLYVYVIFFSTYLLPYFIDGPFQFSLDPPGGKVKDACAKYSWTNLLYINNFYPLDETSKCFDIGWYLATDMQFFLISPIVLFSMKKYGLRGAITWVIVAIVCSFVANITLIKEFNLNTLLSTKKDIFRLEETRYVHSVYQNFSTRVTPYFMGMLLGYILYKRETKKTNKTKFNVKSILFSTAIWVFAACFACIAISIPYTAVSKQWSNTSHVLYGSFFSIAWSLSVTMVIFACQNKLGGIVNDFLSWGPFIALGRLTYATYLVHLMLVKLYYASMRKPVYMTEIVLIYLYLGMSILLYVTAYLFAVVIEFPIRHMIDFLSSKT